MTKRNRVTANIFVEPYVREMMKHNARKDQRYSDFILELIQYRQENEKVTLTKENKSSAQTFHSESTTSNPKTPIRENS